MNEVWEDEGPNVFLIREHLAEFRLHEWNNARVARLCARVPCTVPELCAIAGVFGKQRVAALWRNDRWPPEVVLHFAKLERVLDERTFGTVKEPDPQDIQAGILLARGKHRP